MNHLCRLLSLHYLHRRDAELAGLVAVMVRDRPGWRQGIGIFLDSIHLVRELFRRPRANALAPLAMGLFWAADIFCSWVGMAAFGFHMNVARSPACLRCERSARPVCRMPRPRPRQKASRPCADGPASHRAAKSPTFAVAEPQWTSTIPLCELCARVGVTSLF